MKRLGKLEFSKLNGVEQSDYLEKVENMIEANKTFNTFDLNKMKGYGSQLRYGEGGYNGAPYNKNLGYGMRFYN